jgi:hypothetical protein
VEFVPSSETQHTETLALATVEFTNVNVSPAISLAPFAAVPPVKDIVLEVEIAPADEISRLVVTTPVDAATVICSKPPSDLTGPEKVEFAIISSSEISSIVSACLLGQSIEQVNNPSYSTKYIRLV